MIEYAAALGSRLESLINWALLSKILLLFALGIGLIVIGYLLRGGWGAGIVLLLIGTILFLYYNGLLPF